MSDDTTSSGRLIDSGDRTIGRQISLSWAKAFEISYNSVRIRFKRSLITAGGIVLAIAFLMATLTSGQVFGRMKSGIPAGMAAVKKRQTELTVMALEHLKAVPLDKQSGAIEKELRAGDFKRAQGLLDAALDEKKEAAASAAPLKADVREGCALLERLTELGRMRIKLLERGEVPEEEQEAGGVAKAGAGAGTPRTSDEEARKWWVISLALLVALVGITNSMLMSVTERFREIGTMKCLGALDAFIVKIFLIESSLMGFFGTIFGVAVGLALSLSKLSYDFGSSAFGFVPWAGLGESAGVALGIGVLLALVGAILPAFRAAQMEPVAAMRQDQ